MAACACFNSFLSHVCESVCKCALFEEIRLVQALLNDVIATIPPYFKSHTSKVISDTFSFGKVT